MEYLEFLTGQDDIDRRLDRVARKFLKTLPLSVLYKNIRNGFIRVNGKKIQNNYRLQSNDVLFIEKKLFENQVNEIPPKKSSVSFSTKFETLFVNQHLLIINKPKDINVQASSSNQQSLDRIIKDKYIKQRSEGLHAESLSFLPGPLHRLDRHTTGLLTFSQSLTGARFFSAAIAKKSIQKNYLTVLSGSLNTDVAWEHLLSESKKNNSATFKNFATVTVYEKNNPLAVDAKPARTFVTKTARTFVKPLAQGQYKQQPITLALIQIETGRTHQIRAQSAFCGHPLLGDSAYDAAKLIPHFFLHAWRLDFPIDNPVGLPHHIIAPLPIFFADFIKYHLPDFDILSYNNSNEIGK